MAKQSESELQYVSFSGKCLRAELSVEYDELFNFWKRRWSAAFKEIGQPTIESSDHFLRQAEITGLFFEQRPLGCLCLDWFDVSSQVHLQHSYFQPYSADVFDRLRAHGVRRALVINFLTVDPMAGRVTGRTPLADLLVGLAVLRLCAVGLPHIITYTRNSRKVNELMYRMGGKPILTNQIAWDEPTDFGLFDKMSLEDVLRSDYAELILRLWEKRKSEPTEIDLIAKANNHNGQGELSGEVERSKSA